MKKFLCYDTNDAASGKINVSPNGVLRPNSTVPSTNGSAYQQLVTDDKGEVRWEDRLAYEYTEWKDFVLNSSKKEITGFTMPPVGSTVTVKVNGVESVETVKSGEIEGQSYSYIGSIDIQGLFSGNNGWIVYFIGTDMVSVIAATANPETTVSLLITEQHKIDEKYIQQDKDFVRPLSYYIGSNYEIYRIYYNESGGNITTYKCDNIETKSVHGNTVFVYDVSDIGIGQFITVMPKAFFIGGKIFTTSGILDDYEIYGTDETAIAELAAEEGYTLTTKPTI